MVKCEITIRASVRAAKMVAATGGAVPIFITDAARVADPTAVAGGLPAGAIVIVRDYDHPDRRGLAEALKRVTTGRRQILLIAGDADLARAVGADGIHLPEHMLKSPPVLTGFSFVSAACHTRAALKRAAEVGADLALVSPVFPTRSHAEAATLGIHRFKRLTYSARLPVAALGGVTVDTAQKLRPLELAAFAAIDGFAT